LEEPRKDCIEKLPRVPSILDHPLEYDASYVTGTAEEMVVLFGQMLVDE